MNSEEIAMPGTANPSLDLDAIRACHQQAGRVPIDYISDHDAELLMTYHRHVGELIDAYSTTSAELDHLRADSETRGAA